MKIIIVIDKLLYVSGMFISVVDKHQCLHVLVKTRAMSL